MALARMNAALSRRRASTAAAAAAAAPLQTMSGAPLHLAPNEVHVWWLRASDVDGALLSRYAALLPPAEIEKAEAARDAGAYRQRVLARTLARWSLSRYTAAGDPAALEFGANGNGKPFLVGGGGGGDGVAGVAGARLEFNLSHTSSLLGEREREGEREIGWSRGE